MGEFDTPESGPPTWVVDPSVVAPAELADAVAALSGGEVVAIPTDTYYGLAADPRRADALDRVLAAKGRAADMPLLLLASSLERAAEFVAEVPPAASLLARSFWPGPLTLVLPAREALPAALVGPTGGVAVRVPAAPVPRRLADLIGAPITGTSANRRGAPPVRRACDVDLPAGALAGIVDAGPTPGGAPSTLVDLVAASPRLLREGAVDAADIEAVLGGRLL